LTSIQFLYIAIAVIILGAILTILSTQIRKLLSEQSTISSWSKSGRTKRGFGQSGTSISELTKTLVKPPYKIYTTEFDVEISSQKLSWEFYAESDLQLKRQTQLREIIAQTDTATTTIAPLKNSETLLITFLIDHSGSLKSDGLEHLVQSVDRAARFVSAGNISFEILGFTTRSWQGGRSRKLWVNEGKPQNPGRLCDLMYIVYKDALENYETAFQNLAVMLEDDVRRENIDGEAILWAHSRFEKSSKKKWICVVVSDGAPVDDSTLSVSTSALLEEHLLSVVKELEAQPELLIFGFGIGCDVSRFYPNSTQVDNVGLLVEKFATEVMTQASEFSTRVR
jgi:cobaltochelatase CobT